MDFYAYSQSLRHPALGLEQGESWTASYGLILMDFTHNQPSSSFSKNFKI